MFVGTSACPEPGGGFFAFAIKGLDKKTNAIIKLNIFILNRTFIGEKILITTF